MHMEHGNLETYGNLGIIALESSLELGKKIDRHLRLERMNMNMEVPDTYLVPVQEIRFANGEGKIKLQDSVRGKDIYLLCDIGNYGCTYDLYGYKNRKGPDEHFQDIKRTLSAIGGKSLRTTVIMPLLYASRQHRRKGRESLDCAMALRELEQMGVKDILTFDVHDPNIQNAIPLSSFENLYATYEIVKEFMVDENDLLIDKDNLLVISPDPGAMDRTIYYAGIMDIDVGLFYKRRDYAQVVAGKNPIVQHEYMGKDVAGKNIVIIDDMIASGESVLDITVELKRRNANKIFIATTFAMFTEGVDKFNHYYEKGYFDRVYSTNLTYVPQQLKNCDWFKEVDLSVYLASIIDNLNYNQSIEPLIDATDNLRDLIRSIRQSR